MDILYVYTFYGHFIIISLEHTLFLPYRCSLCVWNHKRLTMRSLDVFIDIFLCHPEQAADKQSSCRWPETPWCSRDVMYGAYMVVVLDRICKSHGFIFMVYWGIFVLFFTYYFKTDNYRFRFPWYLKCVFSFFLILSIAFMFTYYRYLYPVAWQWYLFVVCTPQNKICPILSYIITSTFSILNCGQCLALTGYSDHFPRNTRCLFWKFFCS